MLRYAQLLHSGLIEAGYDVQLAVPRAVLNVARRAARGAWKWVGYVDKYFATLPALLRAARRADVVHICDHSNSIYVPLQSKVPHVVTCHDLLAVRGALGEQTDCPASFAGRWLQMSIMRGLRRADALACVSNATLHDAHRLLPEYGGEMVLAPNALSYPYRVLDQETSGARLASIRELGDGRPFVLNVGSNLRRKNREAVLRSVAAAAPSWNGSVVLAGQSLTSELRAMARELAIADRVVEVVKPSNETLEALYNRALALLFPSRFEGFGWPILEAQACGCPVICSDRAPLPEVSGGAALLCGADDIEGLADAILTLSNSVELCAGLRQRGEANAARFSRAAMIERFTSLYERLAAA
jgi:glycosyltransferase involved in cell wall biosynthesis